MLANQNTIDQILDIEWAMFQRVKSASPVPCQSAPVSFRKIRGANFEMWTDAMLKSYLSDLESAHKKEKNLITEKYARMDGLIPPLNNTLVNEIVMIESSWQEELKEKYPSMYTLYCRGTNPVRDGSSFAIYLKSELETYSDKTIELYCSQAKDAWEKGENISINALKRLIQKGGYPDLDHAEACAYELLNKSL